MKKIIHLIVFAFFAVGLSAQTLSCDELFISEYVEGYGNNRSLEIYNPTSSAIELSGYSIVRFSNGSTTASDLYVIQLPEAMLEPYDVFVITTDKQNMELTGFDAPIWNGYNLLDTLFDSVTGEPLLNEDGSVRIGPTYLDGDALFGDEYNEEYDLQCKTDAYLCPVYDENRTLYFNGNDAVALISGTVVDNTGSNIIDVIGVIGENPEDWNEAEDAWIDENGFWLTKDRSLVRNADVVTGRNDPDDILAFNNGTFTGTEWSSYSKNDFSYLGIHTSTCEANAEGFNQFSCANGPVGTYEINQIPFSMYPNPNASNLLHIASTETIQNVAIYNMLGQQVSTEKIASANAEIQIGNLQQGMYLVYLTFSEKQISIQKLIVE